MLFEKWKAESDTSIPCPSSFFVEGLSFLLVVNSASEKGWLSKLNRKAEAMSSGYKSENARFFFLALFNLGGQINIANVKLMKAACKEDTDDNNLYLPGARDLHHVKLECFQSIGVNDIESISIFTSSSGDIWRGFAWSDAQIEGLASIQQL